MHSSLQVKQNTSLIMLYSEMTYDEIYVSPEAERKYLYFYLLIFCAFR